MESVKIMRQKVKEYIDTADEKVVMAVYNLLEADTDNDWWNEMPDNVREDVEEAIRQADRGEGMAHDEVKIKYSKWFVK